MGNTSKSVPYVNGASNPLGQLLMDLEDDYLQEDSINDSERGSNRELKNSKESVRN
jgi:hypothetical protein